MIIQPTVAKLKEQQQLGKRIVFTNGCFDLLHVGHLRYLQAAKSLGDLLVIGLNSDASVRRLKGEKRPIVPESERKEMLEGLAVVDAVLLFDQDTPLALITELGPDVLVKGGDWAVEQIVGADVVRANGGSVQSLPFVEGKSSTNVVETIVSRYGGDTSTTSDSLSTES